MKSSTKRIAVIVVVLVIVAGFAGWQAYRIHDQQYAEDRDRIIGEVTGTMSHITAYGEQMDYDFSSIVDVKDDYLHEQIDDLHSAAADYQHDIQSGYPDGFWDDYPNCIAYLQYMTDYCISNDFTDYQEFVRITQPLTDQYQMPISSSADLKQFYLNLEDELDDYSYQSDK